MSDKEHEGDEDPETITYAGQSVVEFIEKRTGESPRISLRDEDTVTSPGPLIDPRSKEKSSIPEGRGTYQLMGEIARGGMGVILKGHDTDLGRDVAVKVLDKRLAEREDVVQRFVEEAQIGGQLQHPGIVPVYELGLMADERPYFTMKLVKGRTLATLLTERETPSSNRRRLIDIFESICQTLAYAHSRGVIHRDLKPANIMVGAFGEVQVVDWGLAKVMTRGGTADEKRAREAHSSMTILETVRSDGSGSGSASMVGSILGTPAYMPPEQAAGLVDKLDERTDVFALGAILCEILTGLPPYVGDRNDIIAAAAQADYDDAMERLDASDADPELIKLTKQCLMAAPAARPANAGAVAERIHGYISSLEERARAAQVEAAEARVRVKEEQKARKLTLALGGSIAAIAIVLIGGWSFLEQERADQARLDAARAAEETLRASELSADVNAELAEASLLEASESWDQAILAGERAKALAEGGAANANLTARVDGILAGLRNGRANKLAREQQALDTDKLINELNDKREPDWAAVLDDNQYRTAQREAERIEATFLEHGIDLVDGTSEEAAELLMSRGMGAETALILDNWIQQLRIAGDKEKRARLLAVAHLIDPDPLRADLRAASARGELEVLKWIAEQGLELQPAGTIELLGNTFHHFEQTELARSVYRIGADLYPENFGLQYRLGRMLLPDGISVGEVGDMAEGVACLSSALALRPESMIVRFYLGRMLSKLDLHEQALSHYELLLARSPDDVRFQYHVAAEFNNTGNYEDAVPIFEGLVDLDAPRWLSAFSLAGLGQAQSMLGEDAAAMDNLERAIHDSRFQVPGWQEDLIEIYLKQQGGDLGAAIDRVEQEFPTTPNVHNNVAWSLLMEKPSSENFQYALRLAERAVELESAASNWNTLGVARYYLDDWEGAIPALLESIRLDGWTIYDGLFLAMAYFKLDRFEAAEAEFNRSLEDLRINPTLDPEALRFREQARQLFGR